MKSFIQQQTNPLLLQMLAAIWGCCYEAGREFDTQWELNEAGNLRLDDAADKGLYSFQVEGLLVRFAVVAYNDVPLAALPLVSADSGFAWSIKRADWNPEMASPEVWEQLRSDLHAHFGGGFFSHDLQYSDLAINRLKSGAEVVASSCSSLQLD